MTALDPSEEMSMFTNGGIAEQQPGEWTTKAFLLFLGIISILAGCLSGCGSSAISRDGSPGSLSFGTQTLSDICVVVHVQDGSEFRSPGFGITNHEGSFHLLRTASQDALKLEPGEYSFTLESLGPQIVFPADYLDPKKPPLKVTWTAEMASLDLRAPEKLLADLTR